MEKSAKKLLGGLGRRALGRRALGWAAALALVVQMVAAPAGLVRAAAIAADPLRAAQLLCDPGQAGTPADHHRAVPADPHSCLADHGGVGAALVSPPGPAVPVLYAGTAKLVLPSAAIAPAGRDTAAYAARAPPAS